MTETGSFKTKDGTQIFYSYIEAKGDRAAILLHQFRRDHHSYDVFAQSLAKEGISSVAIDLRGHGKSSGFEEDARTWKDFTDEDFRKMTQDVYSARNLLMLKKKKQISIIGASIARTPLLISQAKTKTYKN